MYDLLRPQGLLMPGSAVMCFAKQVNLSQSQYRGAWCMQDSKANGCNLLKLPNQPKTRVIKISHYSTYIQ